MADITIFYNSKPEIGYVARTSTTGNELNMVNEYIEFLKNKYRKLTKKNVAIFIEPQLDTGYPDIVIVEYYPFSVDLWNDSRNSLTANDLKILFQIQKQKNTSVVNLSELLGYSITDIKRAIVKLHNCKLIHLSKSQQYVRNVPLKSYCRIEKIISIEAKIDKWAGAIHQANRNIWFSTESYVLMNKEHCNDYFVAKCRQEGLGIILLNGSIKLILKGEQREFPVSYASLQFNEWIQKSIHMKEEYR